MTDITFAALAAARWLHFIAAILVFGASFFPFYAWGAGTSAPRSVLNPTRVVLRLAVLVTAASAIAWAGAVFINITGGIESLTDGDTLAAFFLETGFGKVWVLRFVLVAAILIIAFGTDALFRRNFPSAVVAFLAALLLVSQAWIGHAAAASGTEAGLVILGYALHVLGAGAWLGGLVPLWLLLRERRGYRDADELYIDAALHRFSRLATIAIGMILAGGVLNLAARWHSLDALLASTWGQLLIVKVVLFGVLLAFAIQNRFVLMPRLIIDTWARTRLVRNVLIEQLGAIAILGAASLLGLAAPPT
jgi:putative copper resistance protein D